MRATSASGTPWPFYHEEADVLAGGADIVDDAHSSGSLPGRKGGDIDDRDGTPPIPAESHPD